MIENDTVWLFGIGAIVILIALYLGRGVIFSGFGMKVKTNPKSGDINVGNRLDNSGEVGNISGLSGGAPAEGQNVIVANDVTVRPGGKIGDITGADSSGTLQK